MLLKSTPTPLDQLSAHSVCVTKLLSSTPGHQEFGGREPEFWGASKWTHLNAFEVLLKRELDMPDKEDCISSKGSCGMGDEPREGWLSAQLSAQALTVGSVWTLVEIG